MVDKHTAIFTKNPDFTCLENLPAQNDGLYLIYCGREICRSGHRFGPNRRHFHLIHFIKDGKGTLDIAGRHFELKKGDAFWLPPGEEAWYEADKDNPWTYFWIGFDGLGAGVCVGRSGFTSDKPTISIPDLTDEACELIDKMLDANQLTYSNNLKRNSLLEWLFGVLIFDAEQKDNSESTYAYSGAVYAQYARNYIDLNYTEQIRVTELADFIGVNRSYLTNSFKQLMGISIQDYIIGLRISHARHLLRETDHKINTIAQMVGYDDVLSFSKIFKIKTGMSPNSYRKMETDLELDSEKIVDKKREENL